jgi:predicted alpha/beta superfamily hydrolase
MKKIILINLIVFLIFGGITAQTSKVKLEVVSPNLHDTTKIFVAGNHSELGNWRADKVELNFCGNKKWSSEFVFEKGERLEYKFTKGNWATEALGNDSSIPQNTVLVVNNDTTVLSTILNWRDNFNFSVKGQITGKVNYHKNFVLDELKPRDIFVWLPPDYEINKSKRYPVFYMHDGQNLVDPRTSNTFIDWQIDETADSLIHSSEIEPFIIVGINNTDDRSTEYSNTSLGKKYVQLIIEVIKPFIDKEYRTLTDAKNTAVGGSSMGGLISMICAWENPDVFSKAACFSPAFKYREFDYTSVVEKDTLTKKDLMIYIDNGGVDLEKILQPGVDKMTAILKSKGFEEGKNLLVFIDKDATHNEAAWAKRIHLPLKFFFGK